MEYEYVKGLRNTQAVYSSMINLWKCTNNGKFYVSDDYMEVIPPVIDNRYMLMYEEPKTVYNKYKNMLNNAKEITAEEFNCGRVQFGNSYWILDLN